MKGVDYPGVDWSQAAVRGPSVRARGEAGRVSAAKQEAGCGCGGERAGASRRGSPPLPGSTLDWTGVLGGRGPRGRREPHRKVQNPDTGAKYGPGEVPEDEQNVWQDDPSPDAAAGGSLACDLDVAATLDHLFPLSAACVIDLGPCRALSRLRHPTQRLRVFIPNSFVANTAPERMEAAYLPEWTTRRAATWPLFADNLLGTITSLSTPGLYWSNGDGYYPSAVVYALALIDSFAEYTQEPQVFRAGCDYWSTVTADFLRDKIRAGAVPIGRHTLGGCGPFQAQVQVADGVVSAAIAVNEGANAWTPIHMIGLCDGRRLSAALADYHFWWAHRLYAYARAHPDQAEWCDFVGTCCARAAMAEVTDIAGTIVHEMWHYFASLYEADDGNWCLTCCHYVLRMAFMHRVSAALALPTPQWWGGKNFGNRRTDPSLGAERWRFDYSAGEPWAHERVENPGIDCDGTVTRGTHDDLWTPGHGLEFHWTVPSQECFDAYDTGALRGDSVHWGP